jgi:SAM-dependent methyltransferase
MYSKNNNAKEYVLQEIAKIKNANGAISILDFACGTCSIWKDFLGKFPDLDFYGFDFNQESIILAKKNFPNFAKKICCLDGQRPLPFEKKFDIITTFSSLEHVVNKELFIRNIKNLLKGDGMAYINYDLGHFNQGFISNTFNKISELLAYSGLTEKYFTKKVDLKQIKHLLEKTGFRIIEIKFFNLDALKKIHKEINEETYLEKWFEYELFLNRFENTDLLNSILLSVVIKVTSE